MRSLNRHQVRVYRSHAEADDGGYMPGTPEARLSQVWELTKDAWAFFRGADAERRLQRHVPTGSAGFTLSNPTRMRADCHQSFVVLRRTPA
jgi:hypothetical protein